MALDLPHLFAVSPVQYVVRTERALHLVLHQQPQYVVKTEMFAVSQHRLVENLCVESLCEAA